MSTSEVPPAVDAPHSLRSSAWRFLLAGGANTVITGALLTLLSLVIDPRVAYTIVFAGGILLSTYLANRYVYGVRMTRGAIVAYVAMYVVVFLVGYLVIEVLLANGLPDAASGLVVIATAPLTFLGGRLITHRVHHARTARLSPAPEDS